MAGFWHKLKIVIWKNFLIRRAHYIITLLELCIPTLLFVGIVVLNYNDISHVRPIAESAYPEFSENYFMDFMERGTSIYYTPSNDQINALMYKVKYKLSSQNPNIKGVENVTELEKACKQFKEEKSYSSSFFGVVFDGDTTQTPLKKLQYTIRPIIEFETSALFSSLTEAATAENYLHRGFVSLQLAIDKSFMELEGGKSDIQYSVQQFPTPKMDYMKSIIFELLRAATVLSFIFLCPSVLKRVVEEKASGVKELMKLMGVPSSVVWLGWFIHAVSIAVISITVITAILLIPFRGNQPVLNSSYLVIWVFLMLYVMASVFFLFALSVLFKRPTMAMIFGIIVWLASYTASNFIVDSASNLRSCCKLLSALLPNIAAAWGYKAIFHYENRGIGLTFGSVLNPSVTSPYDLYLWQVWLMLAIDSVLYFGFAVYIETVFPGEFGVGRPWYYPFMDCMNCVMKISPTQDIKARNDVERESYEPLADTLPVGIRIRGLRKIFQSTLNRETKVAVDGVNLDVCKEQITALLGHNGAGKTTTMMILTGMLAPSEGTVLIDGHDLRRNMSEVRESLGLCPQHNLLFPDLTVRQHLLFFALLKCKNKKDALQEVDFFMSKLNLVAYQNNTPHELSGGYKRRLCLGVAFIGHSKTVILDEPTSGLDPEVRREIWDLLLSMRGERTILITTHIMEEADVLGDRIAIMDHGRVQCYGTPMFLKKLYGTGYVLSIMKKPSSGEDPILNAVSGVIPEAEKIRSVASHMTFRLPDHRRSSFPQLFMLLQREREPLGVECVGVSITTLEDVFLRVGEIALEEAGKGDDCVSETSQNSECSLNELSPRNIQGISLLKQQILALIEKEMLLVGLGHIIKAALVIIIMALITWLSIHTFGSSPLPPIHLNLSVYGKTHVFYESTADASKLELSYINTVKQCGSVPEPVPAGVNITSALLNKANENPEQMIGYVVASVLQPHEATALYYDVALHSLPMSVNLISNAWLRDQMQDEEYSISVSNHPFRDDVNAFMDDMSVIVLWTTLVPMVLTFWMCQFIHLPLLERVFASRQQQQMAGVWVPLYWLTLYLFDLLLHIVLSLLMAATVSVFDTIGVWGVPEISMLFVILLLYGISAIPFSYFVSFWRDTQASAYAALIVTNIVGGMFMMLLMQLLAFVDPKSGDVVEGITRLLPNFALTQVLAKFVEQVMANKRCLRMTPSQIKAACARKDFCCSCEGAECFKEQICYFTQNKDLLLYLGLTYLLYLALVMLLDLGVVQWVWEQVVSFLGLSKMDEHPPDPDVEEEAKQVQDVVDSGCAIDARSDMLVSNLKKKYGLLKKPLAVKGVSFRVKPGECFGLLGVNGAGKTSTFKMLTGAVVPTAGTAVISGYRLDRDKSRFMAQIGYCPQQDALIESLSAWKLLRLYGALRGIPKDKLDSEVNRWINIMGLREYKDKNCGTYSGGNKRKLSTALALIGSSPLVFLDEPTSGVDPVARRNLWNILISLQKSGQSIVLTSHSMEECEALCNRLGIMVAGQLVCVGSIPYLKNKFKQGSTIKIKLAAGCGSDVREKIKRDVQATFRRYLLKDEHETLLHYQVTDTSLSWGTLFEEMEKLKKSQVALEDYTISETTLEEVFLAFAQN